MKKRVLTLIASLIVVAGLLASQGSNAWFVTAVKRAQNITIGAVSYSTGDAVSLDTVEEDFYGRPRIYPGQNLIVVNGEESALTMFNSSTIDTKIRVKIEYTSYKDGKAQTVVYRGAEDEDLEVEFADNSQWKLFDNGMDGACFYYVGNGFEVACEVTVNLHIQVPLQHVNSSLRAVPGVSCIALLEVTSISGNIQKGVSVNRCNLYRLLVVVNGYQHDDVAAAFVLLGTAVHTEECKGGVSLVFLRLCSLLSLCLLLAAAGRKKCYCQHKDKRCSNNLDNSTSGLHSINPPLLRNRNHIHSHSLFPV